MYVKMELLNSNQIPQRKHRKDVGADVFIRESMCIYPNQTCVMPLGFKVDIPNGYSGFIFSRSSMAAKGVVCQLSPIDPGYTGEVKAVITNNSDAAIRLSRDFAIGQLVVLPVAIPVFCVDDVDERGEGGFGSTDKK
jgi:dUTP pyrophosphatase